MTGRILLQIDDLIAAISTHKGYNALLDQKIDFLVKGHNLTKQRLQSSACNLNQSLTTLNRLNNLIELYLGYMPQSDYSEVQVFLQNVADDIVSSSPVTVRPMVLLGEYNCLFSIPSGGFLDFFVESQYLSKKFLPSCYPIAHEIGHILFLRFAHDSTRLENLVSRIGGPIWKKARKLNIPLSPETPKLWAQAWLGELVADAVAANTMGPQSVICDYITAKHEGRPPKLGSDSHPPDGLRLKLMRDRILRDAKASGYKRKSIRKLKKLKLPSKFEMMTEDWFQRALKDKKYNRDRVEELMRSTKPSEVNNKLAFDKNIIRTALSLVDDILKWGSIENNLVELETACNVLENGKSPNCKFSTRLAALLDVTQGFPNIHLQRILVQGNPRESQ